MKKKIISLVLCVGMLSACGSKGDMAANGRGGVPGETMAAEATTVYTANPTVGNIQDEYLYTGTITPKSQIDVVSSVSGTVKEVNFDVGDYVNEGDILFTMDTEDLELSIKSAQAALNSSNANIQSAQTSLKYANGASMATQIENAKNNITSAENQIENAETSVENAKLSVSNAETSLAKAQSDYETNQKLFEVGGVSQDTLNNYKNALTNAQNSYEQAKLSLQTAEKGLEEANTSYNQAVTNYNIVANQTTEENIAKAQDSLASAQANRQSVLVQVESSQKNLEDAYVKSPISGTVLECNINANTNLSQSATPFVIVDLSSVYVEVNVSEQLFVNLKTGDSVEISVPTLSDENFTGYITSIAPGANNDGTYTVKAEIDNSDGRLKSGMTTKVTFAKERSENALILPRDSVMLDDDGYYVFLDNNGAAVKQMVETGIDNGENIEIKSGVEADDFVVIKGQTYLKDGDILKVVSINGEMVETSDTASQAKNEEMPEKDDKNSGDKNSGDREAVGNAH